jgi:hypothetical protein
MSAATNKDWGLFLATVLLGLPTVVALGCSLALAHGAWNPASAMWFMYQVSRYVAYVGISVCAGTIIVVAIRHATSRRFLTLMELSLAANVLLLWYAVHIFGNP